MSKEPLTDAKSTETNTAPTLDEQKDYFYKANSLLYLQKEFAELNAAIARARFDEMKHLHMITEIRAMQMPTKEEAAPTEKHSERHKTIVRSMDEAREEKDNK